MKKYTISLIVIFLTFYIPNFSQTLTVSNSSFVTNEKFVVIKSSGFTPDSTLIGTNLFWDFSWLDGKSTKTITIKDNPGALPGGSWCQSCDFAMLEEPSGITSFVNASNDILLYRSGINPNWDDYNGMVILPLPFAFGNTKTNNWSTSNGTKKGSTTILADATGTLITPAGIFPNTLRIHFHTTRIDSSGSPADILYYTEDEYRWYTPGIHYPILTTIPLIYGYDSYVGGYVPIAGYSAYLADSLKLTGIPTNQSSFENIEIYPNPTNGKITINSSLLNILITEISIYNITDQKIVSIINPGGSTCIDISTLTKGIYYVRVSSGSEILKTEKLILTH